MHMLFVDESGTPPVKPSPAHQHFTLAGVIIRSNRWHGVKDDFQGYKTRNQIRGEIKWRYFAPHNKDDKNPFLRFSPKERMALRDQFAKMIVKNATITSIACVTKCKEAFDNQSVVCQKSFYAFCLKPLLERFQYFLQDAERESGETAAGLVLVDHRNRKDDFDLRKRISQMMFGTMNFESKFDRIIENIAFQDSEYSIGIQLADFVAGATHRAYEKKDTSAAQILKPSFRKCQKTGRIEGFGVVHHPKSAFAK